MAFTTLARVRSVLDAVIDVLGHYERIDVKWSLLSLKLFVLLISRKLANDRSLGSLLVQLEDTLERYQMLLKRRTPGRDRLDDIFNNFEDPFERVEMLLKRRTPDLERLYDIWGNFEDEELVSLFKEANKWYITMLLWDQQSTTSLVTDEALEIITCILQMLDCSYFGDYIDGMVTLKDQLMFLQSVILFATSRSVKPTEDLLAHTEAVAINVGYFFCNIQSDIYEDLINDAEFYLSTLLQMTKPIDLQVYETYTRVLTSSKLSTRSVTPTMDEHSFIAAKNFLNSLIPSLWEILRLNAFRVVSKDQLQEFYERLRSLRTVLTHQPNNFDMKTKEDIGVILCDAGVFVCSLYPTKIEPDLGQLQYVLRSINNILAEVREEDPQVQLFNFPRTNELGFVDFQLQKLMELTSRKAEPAADSCIQIIQKELLFLRSLLEEIQQFRNEQKELQALWDRILDVVYRVEYCIIDHLVVGDLSDSFSMSFDSITKDIVEIKVDRSKIFLGKRPSVEDKEETKIYHDVPLQNTLPNTDEIVGFHEEAESVLNLLIRGSKELQIAAIVGMPGSGKTTLATKIYNHPSVLHHFSVRTWCPISQEMNKKRVLVDLLIQLGHECAKMTEDDLAQKLRQSLKGKRYLILLDDIWDISAWNSLNASFPNDACGSRIVLTSRHGGHFVSNIPNLKEFPLRELNKEESMELLQRKLLNGTGCPPALAELEMQIVEKCKGLPLTILIVAGLLSTEKQEDWKEIVDALSSSNVTGTELCRNTLELSYKHLPDHLRPCFLYFGAFREDERISVRKLLRIWIAEGFVRRNEKGSPEDVVRRYLNDLVGRCLIMVARQRSIDGGVKECHIHDLLHDFCIQKARDEHFFHLLKGYDELLNFNNEPRNLRRLCIHSNAKEFKQSKLFCPRARSLLLMSNEIGGSGSMAFVFQVFKLLRVLDIEDFYIESDEFPSEIEELVQLAFLAIQCGGIKSIPSSIDKLSNLETFILDTRFVVLLPDSIWNLQKLQYLAVRNGCIFPDGNYDSSFVLCALETLSVAMFDNPDSMEKLLIKFPKIRKLKCHVFRDELVSEYPVKIVVPDLLSHLESLDLESYLGRGRIEDVISFLTNLKKLTLSEFVLDKRNMSSIANKLPNLEVLKLEGISFTESTWEMEEGEFSNIRILKLVNCRNLVKWTACDDQFECLEKLVLKNCGKLKEIPSSCLESISALDAIEVLGKEEDTLADLVIPIEGKRKELGNSGLSLKITSYKDPREVFNWNH